MISYNKSGIRVVLNDGRLHHSLCSSAGWIWCWMSVSASHTVPFLYTTKKLNIVQKQSLMKQENHARCWRWDKKHFPTTTVTLSLKLDEEISKFVTSLFVIFVFGITRGLGCSSCHLFPMISFDSPAAMMNLYFHYVIRKHEGQQWTFVGRVQTLVNGNIN